MAAERRFEHYEVLQREDGSLWELGRGAMGVTYKAFDTDLHCTVALKVINPAILDTEGTEQRFLREARAAAQLRQPNIATVLRLGKTEDGTHFYAMEFCEGPTLEEFVKEKGRLDVELALSFALQVTKALIVAEEHNVVHRDIKPANLIIVKQRAEGLIVKVIDFGLAKSVTDKGSSWTSMSLATAGFVGTAHFSSPEQLEQGQVDVRSDIYSLGATIWFMLTGQPMFSGSVARVMSQHLSSPPPWDQLDAYRPPANVRVLLTSLLAKSPTERPQSALELKELIEGCLRELRDEPSKSVGASASPIGADVLADRWKLLEEQRGLGRHIYRAVDLKEQGNIVAIRLVEAEIAQDDPRWQELVQTMSFFQSAPESMVRPLCLNRDHPERPFLVTEWIDGIPLVALLRRRGTFSWKESGKLASDLAPALDFAVEHGITCRAFSKDDVILTFPANGNLEARLDELAKKPITDCADVRAIIDLLPVNADAAAANQSLLSMATIVPGSSPSTRADKVPTLRDLAALIYELLGGAPRLQAQRYVPLARVSAEGNELLKSVLTSPNENRDFSSGADFAARMLESDHIGTSPKSRKLAQPSVVTPQPAPAATPSRRRPVTLPSVPPPPISVDEVPLSSLHLAPEPLVAPAVPRTSDRDRAASRNSRIIAVTVAAAAVMVAGGLWWVVRHRQPSERAVTVATPAPTATATATATAVAAAGPPSLSGDLISTAYSPNGDIRVEHRSGGLLYLIAASDPSKHHLLRQSEDDDTAVVFSPDEKWLVLNEHSQLNDASSQLYHRSRPDDVEYVQESNKTAADKTLSESAWKFYLGEVGLGEQASRRDVRLSGVEWKPDSSGIKLRFDSIGPEGQKVLPQPYVCVYDLGSKGFSSETDTTAIRAALQQPHSQVAWQKQLTDFVAAFVRVNQTNDAAGTVACYAPRVDYFDQGAVDHSAINRDVEQYNIRWPTRHDEIENNDIVVREIQPGTEYVASFNLNFFAASPARLECVRGKSAFTMHVNGGDNPRITAIQQKSLQREKGTLQVNGSGFTPVWGSNQQQVARRGGRGKARPTTPGTQNDPHAAEILNGILNGMSRGHIPRRP
jgi:serine/threonine protein kinase